MVLVCSIDDGKVKREEEWRGGWGCGVGFGRMGFRLGEGNGCV